MARTYSITGSVQNNATNSSTHRRTNSKVLDQQAQPRASTFKFPATPVLSGEDSPPMGSAEIQPPGRGPLQPLYEEQAGPSSSNMSKHRLSPSLPYPEYIPAGGPRSSPTRSTHSTSRLSRSSPFSRAISHLKQSTPQDLGFGAVFTFSLFVFLLALAGVGYVPPPDKTSMPLLVPTNPHYAPNPPAAAAYEAPKPPVQEIPRDVPPIVAPPIVPLHAQQEAPAAPVVIAEEQKPPQYVEFDRNAPVPEARREVPPSEEMESLQQRMNRLEAQQRMQIRQGIVDEAGEDLVGGSPADPLLDEEHADHAHHEDSVYDKMEVGHDGHSHEHPAQGIEDDEADVLQFHEDTDDEFEVDPGQVQK